MDKSKITAPAWTRDAGGWQAWGHGLAIALTVPGWILFTTAFGFGAFAHDLGFTVWQTIFSSVAVYALPAQVVLFDQLARNAALLSIAFVISLTAVRLLPATVTLVPLFRDETRPRWMAVAAVHFCAVTAWLEGLRRLPHVPKHLRMPHFLGLGLGMLTQTTIGSVVGWVAASALPPVLAAALLFMTPIYFILSLTANARVAADRLAIVLGLALGPVFYRWTPGFDLLLAGLVGGTAAFFLPRLRS